MVERTRQLVERSLSCVVPQKLSFGAIAATLSVSAGHLSRMFKKSTGMTFERYVMVRRIDRARQRLLDPSITVAEVVERCGFCSSPYFLRVFREIAGCTPTEFSNNLLRYLKPDSRTRD